ncbi:oxidoreductase [Dongia sedimenti]|uniref:Oxidoreductase n=1 Tax=Dongia sedimenti TaxID=3064282 RepID=A0ABU0YHZ7_9PROT|nr:oxidoreductase [Rhodospirillaceae bacterium R-7]
MSSPQAPIDSDFRAASTAEDVIKGHDLTGKTILVTGGYAGLGLESVRVFTGAGAKVIVPARDLAKARKALADFKNVTIDSLDLADPKSIDAFADRFLAANPKLHILMNNAGVMALPTLSRDARGNELQLSTNHLGHFQLTRRLWPALKAAHGARVVALSSRGHTFGGVDFDDPNFERRAYDPWKAYGQSKSANALFALHLDGLGEKHAIRAFSLHPGGIIATDLSRHSYSEERLKGMGYIDDKGKPVIDPDNNKKTIAQGASTQVWCAVSDNLAGMGGVYCENCNVARAEPADSQELLGVRPWARDPLLAERLWKLTETLTGVAFE